MRFPGTVFGAMVLAMAGAGGAHAASSDINPHPAQQAEAGPDDHPMPPPAEQLPAAPASPGAAPDPDSRYIGPFSIEAGGWIEVNLLYFPDARASEPADVLTPAAFAPGNAARDRDRIRLSARDTRLHIGATAPTALGTLATYVEYDLFGAAGAYDLRLRHAYLDWTSNDGRWAARLGQDWSLFADPGSYAAVYNPLPLGAVFVRQPQFRVRYRLGGGVTLAASLESTRGDVTASGGSLASAPFDAPLDVAVAARLERRWGSLQLGGLLRNRTGDRTAPGATGWGVSLSGDLHLNTDPRRSELRFQATYGAGIARYIGELGLGFDRYFSDGARGQAADPGMERVFAGNLSYERYFASWISATVQGSYVHAGARDTTAAGRSQTAAALAGNIVLHPARTFDLALEAMRAIRQDDGDPVQRRSMIRFAVRQRF